MFLLVTHSTAVPTQSPSAIHIFHPLSLFLLPFSALLLPPFIFLYLALANKCMSLCFCWHLVSKLRVVISAHHYRQTLHPEEEGLCLSHRMLRNS